MNNKYNKNLSTTLNKSESIWEWIHDNENNNYNSNCENKGKKRKYNKDKIEKLYQEYKQKRIFKKELQKKMDEKLGFTYISGVHTKDEYGKKIKDDFLERNKKFLEEKKEFVENFQTNYFEKLFGNNFSKDSKRSTYYRK